MARKSYTAADLGHIAVRTRNGYTLRFEGWNFTITETKSRRGVGCVPTSIKRADSAKRWVEQNLLPPD
jgi:hypothetical protein